MTRSYIDLFRSVPFDELRDVIKDLTEVNFALTDREMKIFERLLIKSVNNLETWVLNHWDFDKYIQVRGITNSILSFPVR